MRVTDGSSTWILLLHFFLSPCSIFCLQSERLHVLLYHISPSLLLIDSLTVELSDAEAKNKRIHSKVWNYSHNYISKRINVLIAPSSSCSSLCQLIFKDRTRQDFIIYNLHIGWHRYFHGDKSTNFRLHNQSVTLCWFSIL